MKAAALAAVILVVAVAAPAAVASNGALSQLPGAAACVSNDAYAGTPGLCRQGVGIQTIQSIAISPDGNSLYTASVGSDAVAAFQRDLTTGLLTQVPGGGGCIQDPSANPEPGCVTGKALKIADWVMVSPSGANVYSSSFTSQAVDVFARNSSTGALTQLSGTTGCVSSSSTETSCSSAVGLQGPGVVELSPNGKNAYVALFGNTVSNTGGVGVFSVGSDGSLTQLSGGLGCILDSTSIVPGCTNSADSVLRGVGSVAMSPDGKFVYVAARESQAVTIYSRDGTTGALTRIATASGCLEESGTSVCAQGTQTIGLEGPNSIAISPDGAHVYVASFVSGGNTTGTTVAVFSRDSSTGALTQLPGKEGCFSGGGADPACTSVPVLDGPFAVTTSPDGSSVYVTDYGDNTTTDSNGNAVTVFSADSSGALTPLPGLNQCVSADGSGGACARVTGITLPHETVLSPDGSFAYVAGHQDSTIDIFATEPASAGPPSNSVLPAISGTPTPGQTLTANGGSWIRTQSGYAYQWEDCDSAGAACSPIPGASTYTLGGATASSSYTLTSADLGHTIRVVVTATDSAGSASATSAATATVVSVPTNTAPPAVSGSSVRGKTLTEAHGAWSNSPTSYIYQWAACDASGGNCSQIAGATSQSYTLTAAEVGHTIRVVEAASNAAGGSSPAVSAATGVVTAVQGASGSGTPSIGHVHVAGTAVGVPVHCDGEPGASCTVTLTLSVNETVKGGKLIAVAATKATSKIVVLGRMTVTLIAGQGRLVHLSLNANGKRLLTQRHGLKVRLTGTQAGKRVWTSTVSFRPKAKQRKSPPGR